MPSTVESSRRVLLKKNLLRYFHCAGWLNLTTLIYVPPDEIKTCQQLRCAGRSKELASSSV